MNFPADNKKTSKKMEVFIEDFGCCALAKRLNVSPAAVSSWGTDSRRPSYKNAKKIIEISQGSLSLEDLGHGDRETSKKIIQCKRRIQFCAGHRVMGH